MPVFRRYPFHLSRKRARKADSSKEIVIERKRKNKKEIENISKYHATQHKFALPGSRGHASRVADECVPSALAIEFEN